jgi:hypothetical protein
VLFGALVLVMIVMIVMIVMVAVWGYRRSREDKKAAAATASKIRFKSIIGGVAAPFRSNAEGVYEEPAAREAEPTALDNVLAALRAGGLAPLPTKQPGFEIAGSKPDAYLRITVPDPARAEPNTMAIAYTEAELAIDVAFALVPLFGAIGIDMGDAAWLVVDGSRDVASIRKELSERYRVMMQQMMEAMAPLNDMLAQLGKAVDRNRGSGPRDS